MRTCYADKSCRRGMGDVKIGRVTPLRINYGARQTSRLGDHYREIMRIVRYHRCSPVQARNWISRCENTSPRGGTPGYPRERRMVDSRGETSVGQLNNRPSLTPIPSSLIYSATLQGDASLRRPVVSFRCYIHLSPFFPRLTNTAQCEGCEISHVRRVFIIIARNRCAKRLSHFLSHN